jgi:hypothetical protein
MIAGWKASEVPRCHRTETAGGGEERGLSDDQQRAAQAGTQVSPHGQRGDRLHQAAPRGSNHNQAGGGLDCRTLVIYNMVKYFNALHFPFTLWRFLTAAKNI